MVVNIVLHLMVAKAKNNLIFASKLRNSETAKPLKLRNNKTYEGI